MKRLLIIVLFSILFPVFSFAQDKEQVVSLLSKIDMVWTNRRKQEIVQIQEINAGVPGGNNWLVVLTDWGPGKTYATDIVVMLYVVDIDSEEIKFKEYITSEIKQLVHPNSLSWYQGLPGVTISHDNIGLCQIGDFNGDGFDEILILPPSNLIIYGYDPETNKTKTYGYVPCALYSDNELDGASPVEFITYLGKYGYKACYEPTEVGGGPDYVPSKHPDSGKWFFYTWDEKEKEYVKEEEVDPRCIVV